MQAKQMEMYRNMGMNMQGAPSEEAASADAANSFMEDKYAQFSNLAP